MWMIKFAKYWKLDGKICKKKKTWVVMLTKIWKLGVKIREIKIWVVKFTKYWKFDGKICGKKNFKGTIHKIIKVEW